MSVQEATEQSLYHRLGGYDAVAAATDDLLGRLLGDPRINGFWKGVSADKRRKARQLIVDFMTEAAGGPAYYLGADMKKAHEGMQINADDWAVFMEHATATLNHLAVPERETGEVLGFLESLRADVVEAA
jgi:hemoglobin